MIFNSAKPINVISGKRSLLVIAYILPGNFPRHPLQGKDANNRGMACVSKFLAMLAFMARSPLLLLWFFLLRRGK